MPSRATLVSSVLTAAVVSLAAQTPPPQKPEEPQRPTFRTEANFVRVDVFPMRDGAPVKNLTAADFDVFEDGVRQKIDTFEFVQVRSGFVEDRREPNTIAESRDALADPRARVFVLFLDVPHVTVHGAWNVREPLVRLIDRILAPDDLVGIMTPMMAASDIVFARKIDVIAGGLRDRWPWGERFTLAEDERQVLYKACYPWEATAGVVAEMVARRFERTTLDAMMELVTWLRIQREERKAILTISEGWQLFKPNPDLTRPRTIGPDMTEPIPGPDPIGVGPDGRLRVGNTDGSVAVTKTECDRDRQYLSQIDNDRHFRDVMEEANRANASFYTVDPRGLPAFDAPIGPAPPPPPRIDQKNLSRRIETLRVLADNTDGLAAVNSNDIEKGLRRMADDLTSYYLLGYYTSNTKLDGPFRRIEVRVKQPGVDVRARRGYKAATEREVTEARKTAAELPAVPESVTVARNALSGLARLRPSAALRARAIAVQGDAATIWVAGELGAPAAEGSAEISVSTGESTKSSTTPLAAGQRGFVVSVALERRITGPVDVRIRIVGQPGQLPLTDMVRVEPGAGLPDPLLFRRGPTTGNRLEPAGDPGFSRTERARFELPMTADASVSAARILDRNGNVIELPVTLSARTDDTGQRWSTADVILAPLAPGDYLMELSGTTDGAEHKLLTAFRVTR